MSTFPPSTKIIVGPGTKELLLPGYPAQQDALILESDYEGREIFEIDFENEGGLSIGGFRAVDFFGDGSFYLLDTPGVSLAFLFSWKG